MHATAAHPIKTAWSLYDVCVDHSIESRVKYSSVDDHRSATRTS